MQDCWTGVNSTISSFNPIYPHNKVLWMNFGLYVIYIINCLTRNCPKRKKKHVRWFTTNSLTLLNFWKSPLWTIQLTVLLLIQLIYCVSDAPATLHWSCSLTTWPRGCSFGQVVSAHTLWPRSPGHKTCLDPVLLATPMKRVAQKNVYIYYVVASF